MSIELYFGFLLVSAVIILVPGPNVTLILATSAMHGVRAGLLTVAGTTAAQVIQVVVVAIGLVWLLESYGAVFDFVRLAGAVYLVWLGVKAWRSASDPLPGIGKTRDSLFKGFAMGLANPKSLTFFAAFFPQFIDPSSAREPQFAMLAAGYLSLAVLFDGCYAVAGGMGRRLLATSRARLWLGRGSGIILTGGGIWLATLQRE